ncbi:hypothetical protein HPB50_017524 [Hyalomma asiaticum]|uniref:Uncharacterized protein n=1 Tax=Hyalomma asiaticum TaxID=266040 RepID=A0ACB7RY05_HYAAI|nr:hypothetical protein HPB50_017524 [Hyalomma asiaticum]
MRNCGVYRTLDGDSFGPALEVRVVVPPTCHSRRVWRDMGVAPIGYMRAPHRSPRLSCYDVTKQEDGHWLTTALYKTQLRRHALSVARRAQDAVASIAFRGTKKRGRECPPPCVLPPLQQAPHKPGLPLLPEVPKRRGGVNGGACLVSDVPNAETVPREASTRARACPPQSTPETAFIGARELPRAASDIPFPSACRPRRRLWALKTLRISLSCESFGFEAVVNLRTPVVYSGS